MARERERRSDKEDRICKEFVERARTSNVPEGFRDAYSTTLKQIGDSLPEGQISQRIVLRIFETSFDVNSAVFILHYSNSMSLYKRYMHDDSDRFVLIGNQADREAILCADSEQKLKEERGYLIKFVENYFADPIHENRITIIALNLKKNLVRQF